MKDHEPTIRSRELGLALQRAISAKGWKQYQLAEALGWSGSRVSRLISGKRYVHPEDVSAVLAVCGIIGPKRDELMELARRVTERGWWQDYDYRVPERLLTLAEHENSAITITQFQTSLVPGLLQTGYYIQALMSSNPVIPKREVEERVMLRLERQFILDRKCPARFRFFLDEYVLLRTGFGPQIMSDQVHHLLRMTVRPHIEIRVIPDAAGIHGGRNPFQLMEYAEMNPVVFLENLTSVLFLERLEATDAYRRIVADLERVALDEERTRAWLASMATALGQPREEHDAPPGGPDVAEEFIHRR